MIKGMKWVKEANHLSEEDRDKILARAMLCKATNPTGKVGVRPPAYCGEPHPIAVITHSDGGFDKILEIVYQ